MFEPVFFWCIFLQNRALPTVLRAFSQLRLPKLTVTVILGMHLLCSLANLGYLLGDLLSNSLGELRLLVDVCIYFTW